MYKNGKLNFTFDKVSFHIDDRKKKKKNKKKKKKT